MTKKTNDAIGMLMADHAAVKKMFKEFLAFSDRSKVSKKKVADQICNALTVHTQIEEEIFYPAVRQVIKDDGLMDEALVEHAGAKQLIAQILKMGPGDDLYDAKVKVLSEQIDHHVKEEEGEMFPHIRKTRLDLVTLGDKMHKRQQALETDPAVHKANKASTPALQFIPHPHP